jgi:formylglycine-generating enzyme required for sulfatase activity
MLSLARVSIIKIRWLAILLSLFAATAAAETIKPYRTAKPPQQRIGAALVPIMVTIPSGCFQMGSPETENGRDSNETLHRLCINSFKLGKYEITLAEFKLFIAATGYRTDAERNVEQQGCWSYQPDAVPPWDWWPWATWQNPVQNMAINDDKPVSCLSFDDVNAYISWLNKETGHHYRLPTEAEWEYAARAGTVTARYWGNNADIACSYANVADDIATPQKPWAQHLHCQDGYILAAVVGNYRANAFGLHDMLGNVWEWTCSRYDENYTGSEQQCLSGKPSFDTLIALRGGGWNVDEARVRAAHRNWGTSWSRQANLGFRLLREW